MEALKLNGCYCCRCDWWIQNEMVNRWVPFLRVCFLPFLPSSSPHLLTSLLVAFLPSPGRSFNKLHRFSTYWYRALKESGRSKEYAAFGPKRWPSIGCRRPCLQWYHRNPMPCTRLKTCSPKPRRGTMLLSHSWIVLVARPQYCNRAGRHGGNTCASPKPKGHMPKPLPPGGNWDPLGNRISAKHSKHQWGHQVEYHNCGPSPSSHSWSRDPTRQGATLPFQLSPCKHPQAVQKRTVRKCQAGKTATWLRAFDPIALYSLCASRGRIPAKWLVLHATPPNPLLQWSSWGVSSNSAGASVQRRPTLRTPKGRRPTGRAKCTAGCTSCPLPKSSMEKRTLGKNHHQARHTSVQYTAGSHSSIGLEQNLHRMHGTRQSGASQGYKMLFGRKCQHFK